MNGLPPIEERWWQRSATKAALFSSLMLLWPAFRQMREGVPWQDVVIALGEQLSYVWSAALGVALGTKGLRAG